MKSAIIGLLAETSLHPGTGQVIGAVDLPVAREKHTGYPVIVGSSLKGSLRDRAEQEWGVDSQEVKKIFGEQEAAGAVAVTDARLLLLPVRSLNGHFKWVTCPYLLERFKRDAGLAGMEADFTVPKVDSEEAVVKNGEGQIFLEELAFTQRTGDLGGVIAAVKTLILHPSVAGRLEESLVVISDGDFSYFARYGLVVNARNVLDDKTKVSENLWYEETIPSDSLFYALLLARYGEESALASLKEVFEKRPYLQVGGNETVGQGWCAVSWVAAGGAK